MTTVQLNTFLTVCQCMSFTEAAQRLFISQPAVSRQMAALEAELGVCLFDRGRGSIQLTAAGAHLNRNLGPALAHLDALLDQARRIGAGLDGELHIGLLEDQCLDSIAGAALRLLRRRRGVRLTVRRLDFRALDAALRGREIDLAIGLEQVPGVFPGCARLIYADEPMCLAVRRDLLDDLPPVLNGETLSRLEHCPLLVPSLDSFQSVQHTALHTLMGRSRLENQEYDFSSIAPMVSAGLACTIANETHTLSADRSVVLIPARDMARVGKGVFWLEDSPNPMIPPFLACLKACRPGGG